MLVLDGSYGEGGGQILRTALTLSLLTGQAFHLKNIRARRSSPGLRPQHLACVKGAARLGEAKVEGAEKGSQELIFRPRKLRPGAYTLDIGTAGATSLLFQTLYLPLAFSGGGRLILRGGTHVPASPCFHYLQEVFWPVVRAMGLAGKLFLRRYGFYPRGGGEIGAEIQAWQGLHGLKLDAPFRPEKVRIISIVTKDLPGHIRQRQALRAEKLLREAGISLEIHLETVRSASPGTVLGVWGACGPQRAGYFALGARGKPAERVAEEAVKPYLELMEIQASVDEHLADQILLPAALSRGETRFRPRQITRHLLTNAWIIQQFLPEVRLEISGQEGEPGEVVVYGSPLS